MITYKILDVQTLENRSSGSSRMIKYSLTIVAVDPIDEGQGSQTVAYTKRFNLSGQPHKDYFIAGEIKTAPTGERYLQAPKPAVYKLELIDSEDESAKELDKKNRLKTTGLLTAATILNGYLKYTTNQEDKIGCSSIDGYFSALEKVRNRIME